MKAVLPALFLVFNALHVSAGVILIADPINAATTEGNAASQEPFHTGWPIRYQQVYNATGFTPLIPYGGGYMDYIWFRPDTVRGETFGGTFGNIQFNLSTTSRDADNLSLVYAENIGPDEITILGPGELFWVASISHGESPEAFYMRLDLPTPFFYNPSAGNLLLDVTIVEGVPTTFFDAQDEPGDGLSRIWGDVGATASNADSLGLVTRFQFTVIPEPGTLWLLIMAGVGAGAVARRWKLSST